MKKILIVLLIGHLVTQTILAKEVMVIKEQGYFSAGGKIEKNIGEYSIENAYKTRLGQTVHGDHASVFYQIPEKSLKNSIVFVHGNGQSSRCWGTAPDGREGFNNIFLRKGYRIYLVDQPRRGQAGQSTEDATVSSDRSDQMRFNQFRLGEWPNFYEGVQFSHSAEAIDQFFRQMTPNIGIADRETNVSAYSKVVDIAKNVILFTHSAGGDIGWNVAMRNKNVKGIVSFEPGSFVFPEDEVPEIIPNSYVQYSPSVVSKEEFQNLTKIPIIIYFGDNIPYTHSENPGKDFWYATREMGQKFVDIINSRGGNATLVDLPKEKIYGNTHFIFSDLNNNEIAEHLSKWLEKNNLNK